MDQALDDLEAARDLLNSREASASANANEAFRRAVIALEQRLEDLAREHGSPTGDFHSNLVYLRERGVLADATYGRLDRIRESRNCMFHNELDVPPLRAAAMISEIEAFVRATSGGVAGLMTRRVRTVDASAPLAAAEEIILRENVSHVPVVREGRVVGVISELAVLRSHRRADHSGRGITVAQAMEPPLPEVPPDARMSRILDLLEEHTAVLVAERGRPVGIVTRWDLVQRYWHGQQAEDDKHDTAAARSTPYDADRTPKGGRKQV
jgi:predicted transcriptional regulator